MSNEETACPFCAPAIETRPEGILHQTDFWWLTPNKTPYVFARTHLLLIPKRHVTDISSLKGNEIMDLFLMLLPELRMEEPDGVLSIRIGDKEITGSTVPHLHLHYIVPEAGKTVYINAGPVKWRLPA